jgi:4a-hydroxytetrahydrobiopterin dehydratase
MALLDDAAVQQALLGLPEWAGDSSRISRVVQTAGSRAERLRTAVMKVADAMDHHPVIEQDETTMTFLVWSHSAGGVTDKDFALAERIDEVIEADDSVPHGS